MARPAWGHVAAAFLQKHAGLLRAPRHFDRFFKIGSSGTGTLPVWVLRLSLDRVASVRPTKSHRQSACATRSQIRSSGVRMNQKKRKQRKRRKSIRHEVRAAHAKRRHSPKPKKIERVSPPWLRMVPTSMEDELSSTTSRGFVSNRNGRRQPRDLDLYIPENNLRSR